MTIDKAKNVERTTSCFDMIILSGGQTALTEQIKAVQRMQDYIETHLDETITPADLSRASLYSPWYSSRLFQRWTGQTPAAYIRRLRLSRSAVILRDEPCRIADVAFSLGFGSVDGYQRAFYREFHCNPHEYAEHPVPLRLFVPYGAKYKALRKDSTAMEKVKHIYIQTIEKPARKAIIERGIQASDYFAYCDEVGCDVWGILLSMKSLCGEPVCMWLPPCCRKPGTSEYVQGVEVPPDYGGPIPDGFDIISLPAAHYLMFQGEPFDEEAYCEAIEQVHSSIEKYDPSVIGHRWDTLNPRIQLEPIGTRGYIELVPII